MASHDRRDAFGEGALDLRRRLRLLAVALWSAFLGATLTLLVVLAMLPADYADGVGLRELSIAFFALWAVAMAPVSVALLLAGAPRSGHGRAPRHD